MDNLSSDMRKTNLLWRRLDVLTGVSTFTARDISYTILHILRRGMNHLQTNSPENFWIV
jgi:hypothetical protein